MTSQLLIVAPLIGLYEISIIIARIFGKKKKAPEEESADKTEQKPAGESTDVSA